MAEQIGSPQYTTVYHLETGKPLRVTTVDARELIHPRNPDGTKKPDGPAYAMHPPRDAASEDEAEKTTTKSKPAKSTKPTKTAGSGEEGEGGEEEEEFTLLDLPEVGTKRVETLVEAGYTTVADVAIASPAALVDLLGIGRKQADQVIRAAGDMVSTGEAP